MAKRKPSDLVALLVDAKFALGLSQRELGERLGSSARTATRWMAGQATPTPSQIENLARLVHPRNPQLATEIAAIAGKSLEELGIVEPAAVAPLAPTVAAPPAAAEPTPLTHVDTLVDGIVCVAAEAMNLPPRAVRPALLAAFRRARAIGLTTDVVEASLATEKT